MNVSRRLRNFGALALCGIFLLAVADVGMAGPLDGVTKKLPSAPSLPKVPPLAPAPSLPSAPLPSTGGSAPAGGGGASAVPLAPGGASGLLPGGSGSGPGTSDSGSGSASGSSSGGSAGEGGNATPAEKRRAAKARKQAQARQARVRRDQKLRATVSDLIGCLYAISDTERTVLSLRAGLGAGPARSRGYVADRLDTSSARVGRIERSGLAGLRSANFATGCGSGGLTVSSVLSSVAPLAAAVLDGTPQLASSQALDGAEQPADRGEVLGVGGSSAELPAVPGEASGPSSLGMLSLDESAGSSSFGALMLLLLLLTAVLVAAGLFGAHRRRVLHARTGGGGGGWSVSVPPPAPLDSPRDSDGTGASPTASAQASAPIAPPPAVSTGDRQSPTSQPSRVEAAVPWVARPGAERGNGVPAERANGQAAERANGQAADGANGQAADGANGQFAGRATGSALPSPADPRAQLQAASRRVVRAAAVLTPAVASLLMRRAARRRTHGRRR